MKAIVTASLVALMVLVAPGAFAQDQYPPPVDDIVDEGGEDQYPPPVDVGGVSDEKTEKTSDPGDRDRTEVLPAVIEGPDPDAAPLAATGSDVLPMVLVALAVLVLGGGILRVARRSRPSGGDA